MKLLLLAFVAVGARVWHPAECLDLPQLPELDSTEWWGPNDMKGKVNSSINPFEIEFGEQVIQDLKARLLNHRPFTPPLEGIEFEYGFNSKTLETWVKYWAEKYPFSEREKFLNQFPQFKTNIQGLNIYFIHVKPEVTQGVEVVPLLMLHGWPGSIREFFEAIPLLTKPRPEYNFVFELIIPSLPGFGFSDGAVRPGLGAPQAGVIFRNLMHRLGFKKFYIQGGDWGALVANAMATFFHEEILGHHSNLCFVLSSLNTVKLLVGSVFPALVVPPKLADRIYPLSNYLSFLIEEFGYFHIQATKPDTVGAGLTDSPSGLLAYILEKFSSFTRAGNNHKANGNLEFRFTKDQLIDNLMIYWTTNSITTSMRFYADNFRKEVLALNYEPAKTPVPTWAFQAKNEIVYQPPNFLRDKYINLINTTVLDDGGHFLALELPNIFTDDVFKAVNAFREWYANKKIEL